MSLPDRQLEEQTTDTTDVAGSANAGVINLGPHREEVEVFFEVTSSDDDIILEVSKDGSTWRQLDEYLASNISTGGQEGWIGPNDTTYEYARAYPGSNFLDSDVVVVEVSGK
ncbi:MAG: hypothetical protein ABEH81_00935 [Halopenitus sp.]